MKVVSRKSARAIVSPHGSKILPLMDRTTSPVTQCSLAEETLQPGNAVAPHHHRKTEEVYYILRGSGEMTVGRETRTVRAGDAIFVPKGKRHTLRNTGASNMKILLICGPAFDPADVFGLST